MAPWTTSWRWVREYLTAVRPTVARYLAEWQTQATAIEHPALRTQALSSLTTKQFHCEGGGIFSSPSRDPEQRLLPFIVAYQTACDYLDTITDRGPSQAPDNLRQLHQALLDAVTPGKSPEAYFRSHPDGDDGGYLTRLVTRCQTEVATWPGWSAVAPYIRTWVSLYIDLQVYKHGPVETRVPLLSAWADRHADPRWSLEWWEFAAATGSTLGLFALAGEAQAGPSPSPDRIDRLARLYFPWMGALHILLDYWIDQQEDAEGGDLNFVTYYPSQKEALQRIERIFDEALAASTLLEDAAFHHYIARGLLGFYLADQKVRQGLRSPSCRLLVQGGPLSVGVWLVSLVGRAP
ncbi:MAG: tetraprenyl-beta-curcumene synthase family protein [Sulfobacillus sp.]|nr:tetraprenyl-beta-curcumene synthase family protein [Sulfobacillus sp.]